MLEVAFSRRMCCSRVCSASRNAGRPSVSVLTPTSRPGRARATDASAAMNAACGPPKPIDTPNRWAEPMAMSAPSCAGGTVSMQASRSVATIARPSHLVHRGDGGRPVEDRPARCRQAEQGAEAAAGNRHRRRRRPARCRRARRGSPARRWSADGCRDGRRTDRCRTSTTVAPWSSPRRRRWPRRAAMRWRDRSRSARRPSSGSSAAPRAGLG